MTSQHIGRVMGLSALMVALSDALKMGHSAFVLPMRRALMGVAEGLNREEALSAMVSIVPLSHQGDDDIEASTPSSLCIR